jgi:hypothetical protein
MNLLFKIYTWPYFYLLGGKKRALCELDHPYAFILSGLVWSLPLVVTGMVFALMGY